MGDLYSDDITDSKAYPPEAILADLRGLISSGQREGQMVEYKRDISPKDNWPEAVAAFANSFGGLLIFGIEGKGDEPRRLIGFNPNGVESKTRLGSTILSRIQPRPDFRIRVVTLDSDPSKEVAIVRISEGPHAPYMHSKDGNHRILVRSGAQKAEADYLQLNALFEKRNRVTSSQPRFLDNFGVQLLKESGDQTITDFSRFLITPDGPGATRSLTAEVEREFVDCYARAFGVTFVGPPIVRGQTMTLYRAGGDGAGNAQQFGLTSEGSLGFLTQARLSTNNGFRFSPQEFCAHLIAFLTLATSFYQWTRYHGESRLNVALVVPEANVVKQGMFRGRTTRGDLFEPPLEVVRINGTVDTRVALQPLSATRTEGYVGLVMNELVRSTGSVLGNGFDKFARTFVEESMARVKPRE